MYSEAILSKLLTIINSEKKFLTLSFYLRGKHITYRFPGGIFLSQTNIHIFQKHAFYLNKYN